MFFHGSSHTKKSKASYEKVGENRCTLREMQVKSEVLHVNGGNLGIPVTLNLREREREREGERES